jgi:hypothetical protein
MSEFETILDPTGGSKVVDDVTLAPRPETLRGKVLGLLDNGKPNAAPLLSELGGHLRERFGLRDVILYTKGYFGTPVGKSLIQRILKNCDFTVAGIGD